MKLIMGPCVIENETAEDRWLLEVAIEIVTAVNKFNRENPNDQIDFYFKSSFDKANRTSVDSFRGPGMYDGLEALARVKDTLGVKILTDIHEPEQAPFVAEVADVIQIPAFLCRQTSLIQAAAATGKIVNVKKGQQMPASAMKHAAKKCTDTGLDPENVWLTERGTFLGYGDLVVDMRNLVEMKQWGKVIFDATHSVQKPGGASGTTGGDRELVIPLLRSACAIGIDGAFLEVHPNPEEAKSDAGSQFPLSRLDEIFWVISRIKP